MALVGSHLAFIALQSYFNIFFGFISLYLNKMTYKIPIKFILSVKQITIREYASVS